MTAPDETPRPPPATLVEAPGTGAAPAPPPSDPWDLGPRLAPLLNDPAHPLPTRSPRLRRMDVHHTRGPVNALLKLARRPDVMAGLLELGPAAFAPSELEALETLVDAMPLLDAAARIEGHGLTRARVPPELTARARAWKARGLALLGFLLRDDPVGLQRLAKIRPLRGHYDLAQALQMLAILAREVGAPLRRLGPEQWPADAPRQLEATSIEILTALVEPPARPAAAARERAFLALRVRFYDLVASIRLVARRQRLRVEIPALRPPPPQPEGEAPPPSERRRGRDGAAAARVARALDRSSRPSRARGAPARARGPSGGAAAPPRPSPAPPCSTGDRPLASAHGSRGALRRGPGGLAGRGPGDRPEPARGPARAPGGRRPPPEQLRAVAGAARADRGRAGRLPPLDGAAAHRAGPPQRRQHAARAEAAGGGPGRVRGRPRVRRRLARGLGEPGHRPPAARPPRRGRREPGAGALGAARLPARPALPGHPRAAAG